jgi:outer membrane protein OmpA-like peptidoglycan-associated protein
LDDLRFDFDSSFVKPDAAAEFSVLANLWHKTGDAPLAIFGHADPSGDDAYNKTLSGRRAKAVYALLTRDLNAWEQLYSVPFRGDQWGMRSIQTVLTTLSYDPGSINGKSTEQTTTAVKAFQQSNALNVDGVAGPKTRRVLFAKYMDAICRESAVLPFSIAKSAFLARGANADGRGDYQGCGEHNPVLVFSKEEDKEFTKATRKQERDAINVTNRRVLVYVFPLGTTLDKLKWPCPAADAGPSECAAHFWPDGSVRRNPAEKRRLYAATRDTFACRFYDTMSRRSPCEVTRSTLILRLLDSENAAIANAVYRVTVGNEIREGTANDRGWLIEQNLPAPSDCKVEFGYPPSDGLTSEERAKQWVQPGPYGYETTVTLSLASTATEQEKARVRLDNLGYPTDRTMSENLYAFQLDFGVFPADGTLNDETRKAMEKVAAECLSKDEYELEQA